MEHITFEESAICPLANICEVTTEGAIPCGRRWDHLPPLVLAEELCQRAVTGRMKSEQSPYSINEDKRNLNLAWLRLERAMSRKVETSGAEDSFDEAEAYALRVVSSPTVDFRTFQSAALLVGHAPGFRAKRFEVPLVSQESRRIIQATAWLGRAAQQAPIHAPQMHADHFPWPDHQPCFGYEKDRQGVLNKVGAMLLTMRAGVHIYPGSTRETGVKRRDDTNYSYSHDYYMLPGLHPFKVPVRVRQSRQSGMGPSVLFVSYNSLVDSLIKATAQKRRVAERSGQPQPGISELREDTISWLIEEGFGFTPKKKQMESLDIMSRALLEKIVAFSAQFKA